MLRDRPKADFQDGSTIRRCDDQCAALERDRRPRTKQTQKQRRRGTGRARIEVLGFDGSGEKLANPSMRTTAPSTKRNSTP